MQRILLATPNLITLYIFSRGTLIIHNEKPQHWMTWDSDPHGYDVDPVEYIKNYRPYYTGYMKFTP